MTETADETAQDTIDDAVADVLNLEFASFEEVREAFTT